MSIWVAIALSVTATCCYQVGQVMQKIGADRLPRLQLRLRQRDVYVAFLRSRIWLGGLFINVMGWAFFLKAVANAPISIVQPVIGFGLALLALFSVVVLHEHLQPIEWGGVAFMAGGIVLLGISAAGAPHEGTTAVSLSPLLAFSAVLVALLGGAVLLGRSGGRIPLPIILGCGSGVMIGLGALYSRAFFLSLGAGLPWLAWVVFLPLMLFANLGGLWVQQAGFQQGRVLIVVAMNAVTNKVITILGGMVTLGELLPAEASLAAARLAGFAAILLGTVVLARFGGERVAEEIEAEQLAPDR